MLKVRVGMTIPDELVEALGGDNAVKTLVRDVPADYIRGLDKVMVQQARKEVGKEGRIRQVGVNVDAAIVLRELYPRSATAVFVLFLFSKLKEQTT